MQLNNSVWFSQQPDTILHPKKDHSSPAGAYFLYIHLILLSQQ